mgnify:CR=1 FL=1
MGENKAWYSTLAYPHTEEVKDLSAVLSTSKTARRLSESPAKDNVWTALDKKCDFKKVDLSGFKSSTVFVGQTTSLDMYDKKNIALKYSKHFKSLNKSHENLTKEDCDAIIKEYIEYKNKKK